MKRVAGERGHEEAEAAGRGPASPPPPIGRAAAGGIAQAPRAACAGASCSIRTSSARCKRLPRAARPSQASGASGEFSSFSLFVGGAGKCSACGFA